MTGGLPAACGEISGNERATTLWLGPDEFLVVAPESAHDSLGGDLVRALVEALGEDPGQVVDLSANRTTFELSGVRARDVLEKGCSLDLHPRAFRTGTALATEIGNIPAMLLKTGEDQFPDLPTGFLRRLPGPLAARWHEGIRLSRGPLMALSVLDLFSIGIGPSSSHTVGPMRAAKRFTDGLESSGQLAATVRVQAELFGSLGATGRGHGSDKAVVLGLQGQSPETVDTSTADDQVAAAALDAELRIAGHHRVDFNWDEDVVLHRRKSLPAHPNGMTFRALDHAGEVLRERSFYSIGGGFVVDGDASGSDKVVADSTVLPYPFTTADELLAICAREDMSISDVMLANELVWRSEAELRERLLQIWAVMRECVDNGCAAEGILPGGLNVKRRAPSLFKTLTADTGAV